MSKKINIMIALIMCIVMIIPNTSQAQEYKIGVAMRSRESMYGLPWPPQCVKSIFVGDNSNAQLFMNSLNELDKTVNLSNKTYLILCDTCGSAQVDLIAFVFDGVYDVACMLATLEYEPIRPDEIDLPFYERNMVKSDCYDENIFNNGYQRAYVFYAEDCNVDIYKAKVDIEKNTYSVWTKNSTRNFDFDRNDGYYWKSYGYDTYVGDNNYTFLAGNTKLYIQPDVFINHYDKLCADCCSGYDNYEFNTSISMHCVNQIWQDFTDFNQGPIYTNDGYEDGFRGGGSDGSEHHIYLKDFAVNIVTKNRLDKKYNLRDFVDGETSQPLYLSLGYTLDKYQSENLYDYQLQVDISDANGNVKTKLMPLSLSGVTYVPLQSVLSDSSYSWASNLRFYECSRSTVSFKGDNVVVFSYSYDTTNPSYDSSGNRIYPDWNSYKDIMTVSCKLVYKEDTSNNYSKSFKFYGGTDENDDGIGNNDNPYEPDNDDYDGDEPVEPTPNEPSYNEDGINIVINNTNNNDVDDDDDDVNLTIYDDDYTDDALREDIKDGFGLIDNLDTPEKADGFLGLVADFYSNTLDGDFKNIIMFGISSVVVISIIRAVFRR